MPFQSEKQRRYLWANEPEIARDWTDTYGSGIAKALGGRIPFAEAGAVGALTAEEISELETMIQTYPDTKVAEDAQKKLDINAGKSVEKEDIPWYEKLLGFSEAEGAEPTAKETAEVERSSPVDEENIQRILERAEAQSNMQQMMNPNFLESMYGNKGITQALTPVDDLEAQNVIPTFQDYEQREEFDERVRNMPTIQDEGIPASERWRNFLSKVTRQPYRPAQYGVTMGSGRTYSPAQLNKMNALGGFYSDPARAARRTKTRGINVLNRAAAEKPVGNVNQLLGQYGYEATPGGGLAFTGTPEGDPTAGAGYSRSDDSWSSSTFNRGGLADLWRR